MTMLAMRRGSALLVTIFLLGGCGGGSKVREKSPLGTPRQSPAGALDFAWKLSGDRAVAPLQVFSDASHTWLQWLPNQTLPAIFGVDDGTEQLAPYEREGPYTKLEGRWSALVFRGATLQARARRSQATSNKQIAQPKIVNSPAPAGVTEPARAQLSQTSQPFYAITSADKNLRQALARWSGLSGWRFQAEHWAVDVDIPLTATANFSDDFIGSVRALVEATELSERPLQPCFYTNQVLRIVPINEACDRTAIEGARV